MSAAHCQGNVREFQNVWRAVTLGIALLWFTKSFLPNIGEERPRVLILDGHDSHNFLELIDIAISNNIHIIELPTHTSNWLQPCDCSVFGPFKTNKSYAERYREEGIHTLLFCLVIVQ